MIVRDLETLKTILAGIERRTSGWPRGVVLTSGYYDPIHFGHVHYLHDASALGEIHVAIVNGDKPLMLKREGKTPFMPEYERAQVVDGVKGVDFVLLWPFPTVDNVIAALRPHRFAKGGDRTGISNIPEWGTCVACDCEIITYVGGEKMQSSSWLLAGVGK